MVTERKTGAGSRLAGVLERAQPEPTEAELLDANPAESGDEPTGGAKGRGATAARKPVRSAKVKGRTVYIPDDLFERIIVQAQRRDRTISEYVVGILERQVPDHRMLRSGETDAA